MIDQTLVSAFVIASDEPVVVDTGTARSVTGLIEGIARAGVDPAQVRHVAITHWHADHVGGLSRLQSIAPDAVTSCHARDAALVRGEVPPRPPTVAGLQGRLASFIGPRLMGRPAPARVDREVSDGDEVCEGLRAIHTPGHTAGHLSYLWEPDAVLFVGDAASNIRRLGPPIGTYTEDMAMAVGSIGRLAEVEFTLAAFGHGKPLTEGGPAAFLSLASRGGGGGSTS